MTVSTQTLRFVTNALRTHRQRSETWWRVLSSGQQALMVLAHPKQSETYRDLAIGFRAGTKRLPHWYRILDGSGRRMVPSVALTGQMS